MRAPRVLGGKPLGGFSPAPRAVASTPPRATAAAAAAAAAAAERGTTVPPASSLSPLGGAFPTPGPSSRPSSLGPAPSLVGRSCREWKSGLCIPAPSSKPSSAAAEALGGLAVKSSSRSWTAPHDAATVAVTSAPRREATAAVARAPCGPPSPTRAPTVLLTAPLAPASVRLLCPQRSPAPAARLRLASPPACCRCRFSSSLLANTLSSVVDVDGDADGPSAPSSLGPDWLIEGCGSQDGPPPEFPCCSRRPLALPCSYTPWCTSSRSPASAAAESPIFLRFSLAPSARASSLNWRIKTRCSISIASTVVVTNFPVA